MRTYTNLFTRREGDISGWRAAYIGWRGSQIREPEQLTDIVPDIAGIGIVTFEGLKTQFEPLRGWHELIRRELLAITRPVWLERVEAIPRPYIAIHVRRGDFQRPDANTDLSTTDNVSTPLSWFVESLKAVRARLSVAMPAVVTSDGTLEELHELLELENIRLVSTGAAIGDLLVLSRASLLLASGSTFSAWASYLGQMPTLSHPGQNFMRLFKLEGEGGNFVGEFDPSVASVPFLETLRSKFALPPG